MRLLAGFVALACLAACQSAPEVATSDGSDPIVTTSAAPTSITLPAETFELSWRQLDQHLSRDGRFAAKHVDEWVVVTRDGKEFGRFGTAVDRIIGMDFSPDGHYLAVAHPDTVIAYDLTTKRPKALFTPPLESIRFSADSTHLVGREHYQKVRNGRLGVIDIATGKWVASPVPPQIEVSNDPGSYWYSGSLAVFDQGRQAVAAGSDGFLHWAVESQQLTWVPCGCGADTGAVDRAGSRVALVIPDNRLTLWDVASRREQRVWALPERPPLNGDHQLRYFGVEPHFTEDGKWLLLDGGEGGQVWSIPDGVRVTVPPRSRN
ncbi:WD40 repeat domain-containing protein [Micromonospora sp. AMSO12t]|uniref:WD40 repeat domain-containing protein n=1 Tax=Micromonospora sp. AMSO12t TaxID=2650410 RepID=UPI00124BB637|nr:WD40 repeat domain-containing protein [Micromonospora sp. AMSO12t]KAB1128628.1 WD40 repeat domain-containing protein [Micromonospora sp. AMSO12t]